MWLEVNELMKNLGFIGAQNFSGAHFFKNFSKFSRDQEIYYNKMTLKIYNILRIYISKYKKNVVRGYTDGRNQSAF